jgi:hypothetical protein
MRLDVTLTEFCLDIMFVEIVTESKIYHIYKMFLLTIKVAVCNIYGASNS